MKYVITTVDWCKQHNIKLGEETRYSLDGKHVILHYDLIKPVLLGSDVVNTYEHDSTELKDILNSSEWSKQESIL